MANCPVLTAQGWPNSYCVALLEAARARAREGQEGQEAPSPIRLDRYLFDAWDHPRKADVLAKVVGDFSGWSRNETHYPAAFRRLLQGLQETSTPA